MRGMHASKLGELRHHQNHRAVDCQAGDGVAVPTSVRTRDAHAAAAWL